MTPPIKRHGTTTAYRYGCRCDECRTAHHDAGASQAEIRNANTRLERTYARLVAEMAAWPGTDAELIARMDLIRNRHPNPRGIE